MVKYKPSVDEIVGGSYKEGFEMCWYIQDKFLLIERSSISRFWQVLFDSINCNISRDLKQHYPELTLEWI